MQAYEALVFFNGYLVTLAAAYAAVGRAFLFIGLVQAVLGTLAVVGAYVVASRMAGRAVGLLTASASPLTASS